MVVLIGARAASAAVITPTDLDAWLLSGAGLQVLGPTVPDPFDPAPPATTPVGTLSNSVYFNDVTSQYTYVHSVTTNQNNVMFFNTGFPVSGFTGTAGWGFADSILAGGCGGPEPGPVPPFCFGDFIIQGQIGGGSQINWMAFGDLFNNFDATETIRFFYVSSQAPREGGNYNLTAGSTGTAQSFAPAPEPGSIALLGTGLVVAYGAARRRRSGKR
jgi:hypothetical protein